jgi:hypothetical protein
MWFGHPKRLNSYGAPMYDRRYTGNVVLGWLWLLDGAFVFALVKGRECQSHWHLESTVRATAR